MGNSFSVFLIILFLIPSLFGILYLKDLAFTRVDRPRSGVSKVPLTRDKEEKFIRAIKRCVKFIKIVSGEFHYGVFTRDVVQALIDMAKKGVKIQIACGPVLMLRPENEETGLAALAKQENVEIYRLSRRRNFHYRVGGNDHVYWEEPHVAGAKIRPGIDFGRNRFEAKALTRKFDKLIDSNEAVKTGEPERDLIPLTEDEIDRIERIAGQEGKTLNDYDIEDINKLLPRIKGHRP